MDVYANFTEMGSKHVGLKIWMKRDETPKFDGQSSPQMAILGSESPFHSHMYWDDFSDRFRISPAP